MGAKNAQDTPDSEQKVNYNVTVVAGEKRLDPLYGYRSDKGGQ